MSSNPTSSTWTAEEIQQTIQKAVSLGATDKTFRNLALSDPLKAVAQITSKPIPPGTKIRFVENEGADYTVVLPDLRSKDASELSDSELEQVAGGRGVCAVSCGVTSTVSATVTVAIACI